MFRRNAMCACVWSLAWVALWLAVAPEPARGQCSNEVTAVMLVSGIYGDAVAQIELVHVSPLTMRTAPTDAELLSAVKAAYVGVPYSEHFLHRLQSTLGNYSLYFAQPSDFGAVTIIDRRTAEVVFAGTIVWMGLGHVVVPSSPTHSNRLGPGPPADPPAGVTALPSLFWYVSWGTSMAMAQAVLPLAVQTDLLRSMVDCGDYWVVGYTYTPTVGGTDPSVAMEVLIINGSVREDWIPVAVEERSWGGVKTLYR